MKHPDHLCGFVDPIGGYTSILPRELDDSFVGYRIKCSCGNTRFSVLKNGRPLVLASCSKCKKKITLYDTNLYFCATSYANEGKLAEVAGPKGEKLFSLCVAFEYPEDCENQNDISWGYIYGIPDAAGSEAFCILDDESA